MEKLILAGVCLMLPNLGLSQTIIHTLPGGDSHAAAEHQLAMPANYDFRTLLTRDGAYSFLKAVTDQINNIEVLDFGGSFKRYETSGRSMEQKDFLGPVIVRKIPAAGPVYVTTIICRVKLAYGYTSEPREMYWVVVTPQPYNHPSNIAFALNYWTKANFNYEMNLLYAEPSK